MLRNEVEVQQTWRSEIEVQQMPHAGPEYGKACGEGGMTLKAAVYGL